MNNKWIFHEDALKNDEIYDNALNCGATGGKLLGAGGGGFLIFHVPSNGKREKLIKRLSNLKNFDLKLYNKGSEIIKVN